MNEVDRTIAFPDDRRIVYTYLGRSAIESALQLDGLEGGTVMLPAYICQRSFEGMFDRLNIEPIFVDIESETYQMDLDAARTQADCVDAVLLVHPFGLPADLDAWKNFADDNDVILIEDCVRALGAEYDGRKVGSVGRHAVYSLKKVSPVAIGGALVTRSGDPESSLSPPNHDAHAVYHSLPESAREQLSVEYSDDPEPRRLDEITRFQFDRFLETEFQSSKKAARQAAITLREELEPMGFEFQPDTPDRTYFTTPAKIPPNVDRDALASYINTNTSDSPVSVLWRTPWAKSYHAASCLDRYPNAMELSERIVCFSTQKMDNVDSTVDAAREYFDAFI